MQQFYRFEARIFHMLYFGFISTMAIKTSPRTGVLSYSKFPRFVSPARLEPSPLLGSYLELIMLDDPHSSHWGISRVPFMSRCLNLHLVTNPVCFLNRHIRSGAQDPSIFTLVSRTNGPHVSLHALKIPCSYPSLALNVFFTRVSNRR